MASSISTLPSGQFSTTSFKGRSPATLGAPVQVLAQAVLEQRHLHEVVGLGDTDALAEVADRLRRVAAPAQAGQRGHARVVPAGDQRRVDQFVGLPFSL